jgi:hypothetical protein
MRALLCSLPLLAIGLPVLADDVPQYVDDRSTAVAVIQSFYNAIDRKEYARAWSYYADGQGVPKFAAFQQGYATTAAVTVYFGTVTDDGAAGSTYYSVPVSLDAASTAGRHSYFAGCYTLRLANPAIQAAPPFQPLHIVSGKLGSAKGAGKTFVPKACPS